MPAVAHQSRRAFSLIEAAIVLAIVGIVISGVWVAASAVNKNLKTSKLISHNQIIIINIQRLISISDAHTIGNAINITNELLAAGVFPSDWLQGNTVKNPYGGNVNVLNYTSTSSGHFSLRYYDIPKHACIEMVSKVTLLQGEKSFRAGIGLGTIQILSSPSIQTLGTGEPFPVSISRAESTCAAAGSIIILNVGYMRIN